MSEKTQLQDIGSERWLMETDEQRYRRACVIEPESLNVGELNLAVRDLREMLHHARLAAWNTRATATPTEGEERKNHGPEWLGNATREVLHAMLDEHAEKVAKEISEFVRSAAELDERTRTPQPTDAASKGHWCVNCDVCETCRLSECACPEPTDAARAEAHADELSRINAAHEWCAQRGVTVTYHWVHGVPRVTVRVFGGVPMAERYTFVEAVEAARAEDDRLTEARAIAAARKEG
jgi:hypothetical protein